jgi:hypothetical protein
VQSEAIFFELAERFPESDDPEQVKHLEDEPGRLMFVEAAGHRNSA